MIEKDWIISISARGFLKLLIIIRFWMKEKEEINLVFDGFEFSGSIFIANYAAARWFSLLHCMNPVITEHKIKSKQLWMQAEAYPNHQPIHQTNINRNYL